MSDEQWCEKHHVYTLGKCSSCLEAELSKTIALLATERDAFGKKETELMAELAKVMAALEKIVRHSKFSIIDDIASEALKEIKINKGDLNER